MKSKRRARVNQISFCNVDGGGPVLTVLPIVFNHKTIIIITTTIINIHA